MTAAELALSIPPIIWLPALWLAFGVWMWHLYVAPRINRWRWRRRSVDEYLARSVMQAFGVTPREIGIDVRKWRR